MTDPLFSGVIWQMNWLGNSIYDYLISVGIFLGLVLVFKWIQWLVLRSLDRVTNRTKTEFDDALVDMVRTVRPPFYSYLAFYMALRYLQIEGILAKIVGVILVVWLVYQVVMALQVLIDYYVKHRVEKTADKGAQAAIQIVHSLSSVALWAVGSLFVLSNLGVNITSLVAGLGIGGIAVALAAQNILGDLFSSLSIYFDKPFGPGDFIAIGDNKGTVQKIGIKTTRIKAQSGEELIVPNQQLTSSLVSNFGRMKERRVEFTVGVTYDTSSAKIKQIPGVIQQIIEKQDKTKFDRVHFIEFADSALVFEVIYSMTTNNYQVYMDSRQAILLAIKEQFEVDKIEMAYPTQTVYVRNS